MKKIFFLATFLLSAGSASATQMKVVCCDGSEHYFQGVSLKAYMQFWVDATELKKYAEELGKLECKECCDGCYKSVSDIDYGTAQVSNLEEGERLEANAPTSTDEVTAGA